MVLLRDGDRDGDGGDGILELAAAGDLFVPEFGKRIQLLN